MKKLTKEKLENIYEKGLSIKEISGIYKIPYSTVRYWMHKYKIPRRSWSEATYVKRNPEGDPFQIKKKLSKKEFELKALGIGIYWGEGDKSLNNTSVRVGNVDPFLIKRFRDFLKRIYRVKEEKIKYSLILFNDSKESTAINFWKKYLGIKRKQFGKVTIIKPQGKGTYKKKNKHGVLTIIFTNKKLKEIILKEIESFYN